MRRTCWLVLGAVVMFAIGSQGSWSLLAQDGRRPTAGAVAGAPIKVLFLGHDSEHHPSARLFPPLAAVLARRGIQLTYVSQVDAALNPDKLKYYDALMIYANHTSITPAQEKALLDFVEGGKGLVAIHCASAMFTNSPRYIALVGGAFQRHGTGEFTATFAESAHPVLQGLQPFQTWDETYVHNKHNTVNRTVLMERVDAEGREPWTWVRTEGKGRVFYTAYGHDDRTWSQPGFRDLVEHGVDWVVAEAARQARRRLAIPDLKYVDGYNVPNYEERTPTPKLQLPLSTAESMAFVQTPAEFSVELFASEPDIVKPISMAFDERGRLWVIEARDYPNNVLMGNPGNDSIKILEDTNHDGRADKVTVFADNINLATSLTFANGGVIVSAAPHFLFFRDTNGDDHADVRQILSTGWGTRDTHAGPSNLMYAADNYVYGVVGYSGFDGQMNGKPLATTQGAYRFRPDGSGFEYLTRTTNNTWGLGFNETLDVFGSTANGDPSWYLGIPDRLFEGVGGLPGSAPGGRGNGPGPGYQSLADFTSLHPTTPYIRQVDHQGYYTAGAGHALYTARAFPKEYWNRIAFISEPTAHLTGQGIVESRGAGYVTKDGWNLISGAEEWFSPVAAIVGPDGAVWVADWYNFINQHNPTPTGYSNGPGNAYETSMRDRLHGRIYRVSYKGAASASTRTFSLSRKDPSGLVKALSSDNMFWRLHAQRLLVERGQTDVVPDLIGLVRNRAVDEVGVNGGAFHALWTLQALGALGTSSTEAYRAAVEALKHPAAGVRKAAAMVLPRASSSAAAILTAGLLQDSDLHTRLAAVLTLAEMPPAADVASAIYGESQKPENFSDPWLARAMYIAATRHQQGFLAAYRADPSALPISRLPVPLRLGTMTPDWRQPSAADLSAEWKDMQVPGNWEARGLPNFDGVVWFTRTVDLSGTTADTLSLGAVRNTADVWINGVVLTTAPVAAAGRGRGTLNDSNVLRPTQTAIYNLLRYTIPQGVLRTGSNTVAVRIQNTRADGGFTGAAGDMYLLAGQNRTPLAGTWKYRIERSANTGLLYTRPGELAAHVAFTAGGGMTGASAAALPAVAAIPDVVLSLGVVPGQMRFSTTELTVQAGQLVELRLMNSDEAPHNFVLGAQDSLSAIGAAADQLSASPSAAAQNYVPDIAQVLASTPIVNPGQSVTLQFRAPTAPGAYPFACTFPGHWRIMNGVLTVAAPAGRGRGAGAAAGRGAPPPAAGRGQ